MNLFSTLMVVIFFIESFWEVRLYTRLTQQVASVRDHSEQDRVQKVLRLERRWNLFSWVIVLAVLFTPESVFLPLSCVLVLCETIVIMKLDREDQRLK
ncbi:MULTISPECIES: hypothetical protein [Lactobacillaceae]|uniref:Uncharacterized protein n=1 Tax=Limosilactobacillus alvi TaxID=990412 RepID=A0ABS2EQX6_9LACO|nr:MULTISPECIES: hypothetical protein [Lactobacillaceae]MBM6754790.1 hypothetical protein [Limosilactobacillus alvi]QLL69652.1 hypothetical protein GTO83_03425 [Lactobacillus sp. 3B(2020)]